MPEILLVAICCLAPILAHSPIAVWKDHLRNLGLLVKTIS